MTQVLLMTLTISHVLAPLVLNKCIGLQSLLLALVASSATESPLRRPMAASSSSGSAAPPHAGPASFKEALLAPAPLKCPNPPPVFLDNSRPRLMSVITIPDKVDGHEGRIDEEDGGGWS